VAVMGGGVIPGVIPPLAFNEPGLPASEIEVPITTALSLVECINERSEGSLTEYEKHTKKQSDHNDGQQKELSSDTQESPKFSNKPHTTPLSLVINPKVF
jgi:hypothetical protein